MAKTENAGAQQGETKPQQADQSEEIKRLKADLEAAQKLAEEAQTKADSDAAAKLKAEQDDLAKQKAELLAAQKQFQDEKEAAAANAAGVRRVDRTDGMAVLTQPLGAAHEGKAKRFQVNAVGVNGECVCECVALDESAARAMTIQHMGASPNDQFAITLLPA